MRKIFSTISVLIVSLIIVLSMTGCDRGAIKADDISYIEVREQSLKGNYEVDEKIDFSNVYIVIVLKNNKGQIVERVTSAMLEGFDTTTVTGFGEQRVMRIKYKGIYTSDWFYIVTSKYDVNSKARINLKKSMENGRANVSINIDMDVLPEIYAIQANVSYNRAKLDYLGFEGKIEGWSMTVITRTGGLAFVYCIDTNNTEPVTESSELIELSFYMLEAGDATIELTDIVITDAQKDIFLPDASVK